MEEGLQGGRSLEVNCGGRFGGKKDKTFGGRVDVIV